jgi:TonB family protein
MRLLATYLLLTTPLLYSATWKGTVEIGKRILPVKLELNDDTCFLVVEGADGLSGRCELLLAPDRDRSNKLAFSMADPPMTWSADVDGNTATGVLNSSQPLLADGSSLTGKFILQRATVQGGAGVPSPRPLVDEGAYRIGSGVTPPVVLFRVEPKYTKQAIKAKIEGTVTLYAEVDPRGHPINIRVVHGLGHGLDQNSVEAASQWRFEPGYKGDKPVTVETQIAFNFSLNARPSDLNPRPAALDVQGADRQRQQPAPTMPSAGPDTSDFEGTLERCTEAGVAIRLPDGRLIDAAFQGDADAMRAEVRGRFIGDIVRITCTSIPGLYDEAEDMVRFLALNGIRFVRSPSEDELAGAMSSRHRRRPHNLLQVPSISNGNQGLALNSLHLPQSPSDLRKSDSRRGDDFIEEARAAIADFIARMPNYTADETAVRYQTARIPPDWIRIDSVRSEVRFDGRRETRQNISLNNRPWNAPFVMLPGSKWSGGFGETLRMIFDPNNPVRFTPLKTITYNGKQARVYAFSAPKDGLGSWYTGYQSFYPAYEGTITIRESDLMVVRIESKAKDFPPAFPVSSVEDVIIWDWVVAGNSRHLLPVKADAIIVQAGTRQAYLTRLEYANHRHFQSSSSITFGK